MKILHVIPGMNEPTNGIANAAKRIAAEQEKLGHEVKCVETREFVSSSTSNLNLSSYDVAFVHSMWLPMTIRAVWIVKRQGVKLVRMPHGCMDPKKVTYHWWKKLAAFVLWERKALKAADVTYVTCDAEARWMKPWVGRIVNVPLGVDFGEEGREDRSRSTAEELRVLFIGRMHPLKGLDVLLEAVRTRPEVELTVIGFDEKGMRARFEAWCARAGCAGRVRFLGVVEEDVKRAEIGRCDVFCLPTLSENFGIVVGEAMSRGKPVITTDGATSWSQLPADCGWYLDGFVGAGRARRVAMVGGALDEARARRGEQKKMGEAAARWVRDNFDWSANVRRLMREL